MNTYIFTIRKKGARKSVAMTVRADTLEAARADFDARRPAGSHLLGVTTL